MTKGLPPLPIDDPPLFELGERACRHCKHSFYASNDTGLRYLRCGRNQYAQQCRYERHETGECGPDAIYFKERSA